MEGQYEVNYLFAAENERGWVRDMDLSKVKSSELVAELKTREGVKMIIAEPYQNGEVSVEGPAVILVVMD